MSIDERRVQGKPSAKWMAPGQNDHGVVQIKLTNISFSYPVFDITSRSLKVTMMRHAAGAKLVTDKAHARVLALSNISLELHEGDRLGLIGHNGSGKSTLLRVLARLAHPERGIVEIKGKVIPLIEKALGVNGELTGRENIELPLRLLGATSAEVRAAQVEIPEWTGLGPFIDMPFRTYSDGMKVRLMFALSTSVAGDILILDEWLGAGDAAFVERAQVRLNDFINRSKILVLSTHQLNLIEQVCNKVAWLSHGEITQVGSPAEVLPQYRAAMHSLATEFRADQ